MVESVLGEEGQGLDHDEWVTSSIGEDSLRDCIQHYNGQVYIKGNY